MSISLYTGRRSFNETPVITMMVVNALFAVTVAFGWTIIANFIAEPISWATWEPLSSGSQPEFFDYPFILLWAMPMAGMVGAWSAKNLRMRALAYFCALSPILLLSMIFSYFYFIPLQYH